MGEFGEFMGQLPGGFVAMLGFFVLLFVVAVVLLFFRVGSRNKSKRITEPAPTLLEPAPQPDLPDLDLLLSPASDPVPVVKPSNVTELLVVARSAEDGALIFRLDDTAYVRPAEADAETKRRLAAILRELAKPVAGKPAAEAQPVPVAEPVVPVQVAPPETAIRPAPLPATPPQPVAPRPAAGVMPGDLPKFNTIDAIPLKFRGGKSKEVIPEINIAEAIEAYLQFKLAQTPEYAARNIHVQPSPHGGVQIEVDGRHYEAVADIEDIPTRGFLEATIAEWQARQ